MEPIDQRKIDRQRKLDRERQRRWRQRRREEALQARLGPSLLNIPANLIAPVAEDEDEKVAIKFFPAGPYPAQKRFLDLLNTRKYVCFYGGRQVGKSTAGIAGMAHRIYRCPAPMGVGWIVSPTYPMAEQLRYKIEDVMAPLIVDKKEGNTPVYFFEPPPGLKRPYRVEIKTAEKPDRLRGPTLDWMWLDEARNMDRSIWPIIVPTVAVSKGPIFATTTPAGKDWVWEKFRKPADAGDPSCGVVVAKSADAGHFTEADVQIMRSQMSVEMARQELDAEIVAFDGLVYPQFNTDVHVVDPIEAIPEGAEVVGGVDFGWKDPFVHLWILKHQGVFIVIGEHYRSGQFIKDHVASIKASQWHKRTSRRWADPSGPQMMAELHLQGVGTFPANNDIKLGVDAIKRLLEQRKLFVTRDCVNVIREFGQYHYPETKEKNTRDIPHDSFNHAMDALRYAVVSEENYKIENPYGYAKDDGSIVVHGINEKSQIPWSEEGSDGWEGIVEDDDWAA